MPTLLEAKKLRQLHRRSGSLGYTGDSKPNSDSAHSLALMLPGVIQSPPAIIIIKLHQC